jgi:hypothetical protein
MPRRLSTLIGQSSTVLRASPLSNRAATAWCGCVAARGATDSGSHNASTTVIASGSTPPTTKIAGQPNTRTSWLASNPPTAKPIATPVQIRIRNRPRRVGGAKSKASVVARGMPPPRPKPVRNCRPANCTGEPTRAESSEKIPNTVTQPISTGLRPSRSPSNPALSEPSSSPTLPQVSAAVNTCGRTCQASTRDGIA